MFVFPKEYQTVVIGGGHAGIEAALAAARIGCETLLITLNADSIGQMSCNPAIGGLAKGNLVREVDALGGEMGINTDMTGLQFRMLNTTKGPAVWSPRAQCDKKAYQGRMKWVCEKQPNLDIVQTQATEIVCSGDCVVAVRTSLEVEYKTSTVVVTTGTFLQGLMHIGRCQERGGRAGDGAAVGLSGSLAKLGIELGRMKTGTPPRILKRSVDFARLDVQRGDTPVPFFTNWTEDLFHVERFRFNECFEDATRFSGFPPGSILSTVGGQMDCHITHTTPQTARIIRENLSESPLYGGAITGVGPRYCPSIEDKIVRFQDRERHQIFLEPEGICTDEIYVNGLSTSLPFRIQVELIHSVIGCERASVLRPAYAVEYDFAYPTQLHPTLETKACRGLFLAGQINGTSGYEEAAAQGIVAGINASRRAKGSNPITIRRDDGYVGVLVDDLVSKGTTEPYRMFTSRAEHRLLLRQDNADLRLSRIGFEAGLLSGYRFSKVQAKEAAISKEMTRLATVKSGTLTLAQILARPEIRYRDLPSQDDSLSSVVIQQVETDVKYAGYIKRQQIEADKLRTLEDKVIPKDFDFLSVPSLRTEARQKLCRIKPRTLGQASRISGVSPADISILAVWMKRLSASPQISGGCQRRLSDSTL